MIPSPKSKPQIEREGAKKAHRSALGLAGKGGLPQGRPIPSRGAKNRGSMVSPLDGGAPTAREDARPARGETTEPSSCFHLLRRTEKKKRMGGGEQKLGRRAVVVAGKSDRRRRVNL